MSAVCERFAGLLASWRTAATSNGAWMSRVYAWLAPAVVFGVGLWWFCTIPPYATPSLPADWSPECEEWKPQWQSVPTPHHSTINLVSEEELSREGELLIKIIDLSSIQLQRLDMESGEVLAESSLPSMPRSRTEVVSGSIRLHDDLSRGRWPSILWLEPATLQVQREMRLQSSQVIGIQDTVRLGTLAELPDGGVAGILTHQFQSSKKPVLAWFRTSAEGRIIATREFSMFLPQIRDWSAEFPDVFLLYPRETPITIEAIDVATGATVQLPGEILRKVQVWYRELPFRHSPVPTGRGSAMTQSRNIRGYWALIPEISHPLLFGRHSDTAPQSGFNQLRTSMAKLRRTLWGMLYGASVLEARANETYRLDALICYHPESAEGDRQLTGSVVEVARTQVRIDSGNLRRIMDDPSAVPDPQEYVRVLETGVDVSSLGGGHLLVKQLVEGFPTSLTGAATICRYGLLPKDATSVTWLGWLPAPESSPYGPITPHVEIRGDVLLLWASGANRPANQYQPASNRPFQWATLPLPPELSDLPEGPLR